MLEKFVESPEFCKVNWPALLLVLAKRQLMKNLNRQIEDNLFYDLPSDVFAQPLLAMFLYCLNNQSKRDLKLKKTIKNGKERITKC